MPHVAFSFGIKRWFTFDFELGTQLRLQSKKEPTQSVVSDKVSRVQASEPANASGGKCVDIPISSIGPLLSGNQLDREPPGMTFPRATSTEAGDASDTGSVISLRRTAIEQLSCPLFGKLPNEIRFMVYKQLLKANGKIENAHKLLSPNMSLLSSNNVRPYGISSTILCTCQQIYYEARPVLYKKNRFRFRNIEAMEAFARDGLEANGPTLIYGFRKTTYGRLTEITWITLYLGKLFNYSVSRDPIIEYWQGFFNNSRSYDPVAFPSLRKMRLDFSRWQLADKDSVMVSAIVKRFELSGKLQQFTVKGITHEQNLRDLRDGFVKPGGKFFAIGSGGVLLSSVKVPKDSK